MHPEDEWNLIRKDRARQFGGTSMGLVRIALLFGFIAVAFAMILVPIADDQSRLYRADSPVGIDNFKTGTIGHRETYTIRRSVLQPSPHAVCTIRGNGQREGDC
jgi:hypothetical protein